MVRRHFLAVSLGQVGKGVPAGSPVKPLLKITKKFPSGKEPEAGALIRSRP
jgi:hypothetical protein